MNLTAKMEENKKEEKAKLERVMPVTGHKLLFRPLLRTHITLTSEFQYLKKKNILPAYYTNNNCVF